MRRNNRSPSLAIGLLSGTSADGIDVAVVEAADTRPRIIAAATYPYRAATRRLVREAATLRALTRLHRAIGEEFAAAVNRLLGRSRIPRRRVAVIGSHGQTVWHEPRRMSLQFGSAAVIAARTGIPVAADFRGDDIAAGGEGAPLVPVLDRVLLAPHSRGKRVAALNIGGIANLSIVENGRIIAAFDTGPGNSLIDAAMRRHYRQPFDREGARARQGRVNEKLLRRLLRHPFFRKQPPKSTGLEEFGAPFIAGLGSPSPPDLLATLVELTSRTIARDLIRFNVREVWIAGGGLRNAFLMERLATLARGVLCRDAAGLGLDPDFKEAALFAMLGMMRLRGEKADLRAATGAKRPAVLGGLWVPS